MGAFADLLDQLDTDDRVKGKQFEHICKWFLSNDPVYKHELRRVWLWNEWPGRWGIDAGIDLVAEDRQGHLWAIQAKAYAPAYRVTKRDVNKFLAESGREMFTYRMLIATTNLIDRIGERTIQDQEKRVTFFRLNDLQAANVDWPASPTALLPARPRKPVRPHDYQRDAIKNVINGFDSADRGQLIMACGAGKTLTALFIREKLAAERSLVLVPSLSLLKQTLNVWRANCTSEFASLPVCSDDTVARDDDAPVSHTSDIGVPVTTDPAEIAAFLRQRSGPRVVFATYQSSPQVAKAFTLGRVPAFDLVVGDEAHRCAGPVSSDFATVLDPVEIKAKRRLFMTATPRYFTGRVRRAAQDADYEIASMDDEAKFGTVFHKLSFGEAIKRDLLTDYQVAIIGVDDATYRSWAERGTFVTLDGVEVTNATALAGQIGLAKAMKRYDLHRVISFHSRVKRAQEFANSMPDVLAWMPPQQRPKGELWSRHASGAMPAGDRYFLLQRLGRLDDGDRGLLANARCLAEGVDVPTLDGVAFVDPRRSEVDIVQAVGRAIRKSEDKTIGTNVIPVFIDTDDEPAVALDNSVFKPVWDVVRALRAHDEELGSQLDELRRESGRHRGRPRLPDRIHFDLPATVDADFARAFEVRLIEQTTVSWEFWFGLLEAFVQNNGHARVPPDCRLDGYQLGTWVGTQRAQYSKRAVDASRVDRLLNLPGWTFDPFAEQWEEGFRHLANYVERFGHARPSASDMIETYRIGRWVTKQRTNYSKGKLNADRRRLLENLHPSWTWNAREGLWDDGFRHLRQFVDQHGHARVSRPYVVDGFPLGEWVKTQRNLDRRRDLEVSRVSRLEGLHPSWTWDPYVDQWEEGFTQLLRYVDRHGHARPGTKETIDGYPIGTWVNKQRNRHARGTRPSTGGSGRRYGPLEPERVQRLLQVPGWTFHPHADRWEEGISHLLKYVERNGHSRARPSETIDGYQLGRWITSQRAIYKKGKLSAERRLRLEESHPTWSWDLQAGEAPRQSQN